MLDLGVGVVVLLKLRDQAIPEDSQTCTQCLIVDWSAIFSDFVHINALYRDS